MSADQNEGAAPAGAATTLAQAYELTSVPMCSLSWPAFEFVTANAAYRAFSGRDDLIGRNGRDMFPEFEGQQVFEMLERSCVTAERRVLREWRIQLATDDGAPQDYYLDLIVDPVAGQDGQTARLQIIVIDVTDQTQTRLRAEAEARSAGQRLTRAMDVVEALQNALLPEGLPVLPRVDVAASYRLADDDLAAGGDWFDVVPLPDGRVALSVGDVVGHGVEASAVMGQLRSVLGSALLSGLQPAAAVEFLDRFASVLPAARAATAVVALLEPQTGNLTYATAGHLPPLVVTAAGEATFLERTEGGPLVAGPRCSERTHRLGPGDTVMMFSDGLVERPSRPPAESMVEILQVASDAARGHGAMVGASASAADRVAAWTIELLTRETGTTDDVTALAAQLRITPTPSLDTRVAAVPDAVRSIREDIGDWCQALTLDAATRLVVQHTVNELVANVVEHAYPANAQELGSVRASARVLPSGALELLVSDDGRWQSSDGAADPADRGRGLSLVGQLVDEVEVIRGETGTTVRARYRLTRPVNLDTTPGPVETIALSGYTLERPSDQEVVATGVLDLLARDELRRVLMASTQAGARPVTVDLSGVTLLGSAAISVLLHPWMRQARLYAPLGSTAQHVLELVGMDYTTVAPLT